MKNYVPLICFILTGNVLSAEERPNIIWIFAEDTSPWMGCYGHEANQSATPNIDSIAAAGVRFDRAFVPAPVCSACRSVMMCGTSQIRFGAHEHRSSRAKDAQLYLPQGMKLLPQLMKEAGYSTYNHGKTDYNFVWDNAATYSKLQMKGQADSWSVLGNNQPFFVQFQTKGGKSNTRRFPQDRRTDPATVTVAADYPQNDVYRDVVAQHCDAIRTDDDHIGEILAGLKNSGLGENTIVVYFSDHGANHLVRHKQMPTEGGLHVPFMMMGPDKYVPKQGVRNDLISTLDLSATTLAWAGIEIPDWYEGRDLFADDFQSRNWVASAKDRLDHTIDRVRTIRTNKYRFTRNYKLDRVLLQPQYRDSQNYLMNLKELYASGKLSQDLTRIYFGERPAEEIYDVVNDPAQVHNLLDDPGHSDEVKRHRRLLDDWLAKGDAGAGEESLAAMRHNGDDWQGGRGVNPEYEVNRPDSDGDGLSDKWEVINKRDPADGRLVFEFDCGGWQTEGWESSGIPDNIAGFQGYLGFALGDSGSRLVRKGLKATVMDVDQYLVIRIRAEGDVEVQAIANGRALRQPKRVTSAKEFARVEIPLKGKAAWKGTIELLEVTLSGNPGTEVEVDSITVQRTR
ncbi:MAG: sulfatase-like hydrolase/transferase [Fuerstiella sp.]|nr:sulfatase-like hydrolase/transferase [Fuerstiella sp.]